MPIFWGGLYESEMTRSARKLILLFACHADMCFIEQFHSESAGTRASLEVPQSGSAPARQLPCEQ